MPFHYSNRRISDMPLVESSSNFILIHHRRASKRTRYLLQNPPSIQHPTHLLLTHNPPISFSSAATTIIKLKTLQMSQRDKGIKSRGEGEVQEWSFIDEVPTEVEVFELCECCELEEGLACGAVG